MTDIVTREEREELRRPHKDRGGAIHLIVGPLGISISRDPYHQWIGETTPGGGE